MISLKKYLGTDGTTETNEALIRVFRLLLEGIGLHLVDGSADDQIRLHTTLQQVS